MRRAAGALAIGAAVFLFLPSVLPYMNVPGRGTFHRLTALGDQQDLLVGAWLDLAGMLLAAGAAILSARIASQATRVRPSSLPPKPEIER